MTDLFLSHLRFQNHHKSHTNLQMFAAFFQTFLLPNEWFNYAKCKLITFEMKEGLNVDQVVLLRVTFAGSAL